MKSLQKRLSDASDLAAVLGIKNRDVVAINVYLNSTTFHLHVGAFGRVFRQLGLRRSAMTAEADDNGNLHARFSARGVTFVCLVRAEIARTWLETLHREDPGRLPQQRQGLAEERVLALPAPT